MVLFCVAMGAYNGATYIFLHMVKHYEKGIKSKTLIQFP